MNKILGITLAVLGIGIAVVPSISDCASQGRFMTNPMGIQMAMKCSGIRVPGMALGIPLVGVGAVMAFNLLKSTRALFSLSILAVLLGAGAILAPGLNGTCGNPVMTCNTIEKPAVIGIGSLAVAGGLAGMVLSRRAKS